MKGTETPRLISGRAAVAPSEMTGGDDWRWALADLEEQRRLGGPVDLESLWVEHDPGRDIFFLAGLVKADLRIRFERGEAPRAAEYLERFAPLRADKERAVSLIYEEYCLREEGATAGEGPDPESFCARYPDWSDSLRSQLAYHRVISQLVTRPKGPLRMPKPGEEFLGCRIDERLGEGGAASVFRAREVKIGDRVVVLKLSSDQGEEQDILGKLEHPHIVPILWAKSRDEETGLRALCMPYRQGSTLDRLALLLPPPRERRSALVLWDALRKALNFDAPKTQGADRGRPSLPDWPDFPHAGSYADAVAWLGWKLAEALAHAHERKIVHRDLKPANVLLTVQEGPKLLDFNLAHDPNTPERAESAMRGGTLPYMAPEQIMAFLDDTRWDRVGPAADLFGLGLVLRELLTGEAPASPGRQLSRPRALAEMLDRRLQPLPPLAKVAPWVPRGLAAILDSCTEPWAQHRYPSAAALADDLRRFVERKPLRVARNPSVRERVSNVLHRWRGALRAAAAVFALLAVAGAWKAAPTLRGLLEGPPGHSLHKILSGYGPTSLLRPEDKALARRVYRDVNELQLRHPNSRTIHDAAVVLACVAGLPGPMGFDRADGDGTDAADLVPPDPGLARAFLEHGKDHLLQPGGVGVRIDECLAAFRMARALDPEDAEVWLRLAEVSQNQKDYELSYEQATRAIEIYERGATEEIPRFLTRAYGVRAGVSFLIAESDRDRAQANAPGADARLEHLRRALRDIERAEASFERSDGPTPDPNGMQFRMRLYLTRANIQSESLDARGLSLGDARAIAVMSDELDSRRKGLKLLDTNGFPLKKDLLAQESPKVATLIRDLEAQVKAWDRLNGDRRSIDPDEQAIVDRARELLAGDE
jgi:serine/threonine protein kinase